jgi:GT2 family glycosyltransferase
MEAGRRDPAVTIAIVTRDRKAVLRDALSSALGQEGSIEVIVVDDGSRDGTAAMVRDEFPEVRVVRFEEPAGLAARRNDATAAARAEVIVSIDDDAVFSSDQVVRDTLADLDHERIGAVAIPYIDMGTSEHVQQRAPDMQERWVTSIFRGTAYAIRREVLVEIGGFSSWIVHQGEEWDLSYRFIDAGYVVRLGRSAPIHHHASPQRDLRKMDFYGRRNELLVCWLYFPAPWHFLYMLGYPVKGLMYGMRVRRFKAMFQGIFAGLRPRQATRTARRPIRREAFRFDRRARAQRGLSLSEAERILGPSGAALQRPPGWPEPIASLHAPLRGIRTWSVAKLGQPVRCEVCGDVLFRGFGFVWRGRLKLVGAESAMVRADWDKMNRLTFRHVEADKCRPT